jgi:hypothetical protein
MAGWSVAPQSANLTAPRNLKKASRLGDETMITFVRTVSIAPGRIPEAFAFAHQTTKLIKEKFGLDVRVSVPIGGNPNRLGFAASYANLAEFEAAMSKITADGDYMKLITTNAENFLPGSAFDEIWRSI